MKRHLVGILAGAFLALTGSAEAAMLTGGFSTSGSYRPVDAVTGGTVGLGSATGIDFLGFNSETPSPGVPGTFAVNQATGDFNDLTGGLMKDFAFAGPGSAAFPTTPISFFEQVSNGISFTVRFDLLTVGVVFQNATALVLSGSGFFLRSGFDATPGTFTFTSNSGGGTFSFSASQSSATVPDAGSTLLLLGTALVGLTGARRRFARP